MNDLDQNGPQTFPFKSFEEFMEFDERMPIEQLLCAELINKIWPLIKTNMRISTSLSSILQKLFTESLCNHLNDAAITKMFIESNFYSCVMEIMRCKYESNPQSEFYNDEEFEDIKNIFVEASRRWLHLPEKQTKTKIIIKSLNELADFEQRLLKDKSFYDSIACKLWALTNPEHGLTEIIYSILNKFFAREILLQIYAIKQIYSTNILLDTVFCACLYDVIQTEYKTFNSSNLFGELEFYAALENAINIIAN
ncbi:uncharacterized protein LOC113364200 [Ctenocephalides felis]|uniref:uncharacterized protein LOC113364200 n=1 Tax=Ctenocephalides felis TaxID=7515 RepID=UPI000E6E47AE|nr:uncharacterized protein LOC113364200 [Ctenocephalides felis]